MGKRNISILLGCNESSVTESLRALLADFCQDEMTFTVKEMTRYGEFVREACTGSFDVAIIFGNCLHPSTPSASSLLENFVLAIKAIKAIRPIPVVALTSMPEWQQSLSSAGANFCFETPMNAVEFKKAISSCIQRQRLAD